MTDIKNVELPTILLPVAIVIMLCIFVFDASLVSTGEAASEVDPPRSERFYKEFFVAPLPDGRELMCLYMDTGRAGLLSCDWEGITP